MSSENPVIILQEPGFEGMCRHIVKCWNITHPYNWFYDDSDSAVITFVLDALDTPREDCLKFGTVYEIADYIDGIPFENTDSSKSKKIDGVLYNTYNLQEYLGKYPQPSDLYELSNNWQDKTKFHLDRITLFSELPLSPVTKVLQIGYKDDWENAISQFGCTLKKKRKN